MARYFRRGPFLNPKLKNRKNLKPKLPPNPDPDPKSPHALHTHSTPHRTGLTNVDWIGLDWIGLDWIGLGILDLDLKESGLGGLDWVDLNLTGLDITRLDLTTGLDLTGYVAKRMYL